MAKSQRETQALLASLLSGAPIDSKLIDELRANHEEGQWLDFKSGTITNDKPKTSLTVREYVAGFGNADGGVPPVPA